MSFAHRIDANQPEIVKAFRGLGCSVAVTSMVGNGFADLVVAKNLETVLVEVKDGSRAPSERKLTPDEQKFRDAWKGRYAVVEGIPDVIKVVELML